MRPLLPMLGLGAKKAPKTQTLTKRDIALSRWPDYFGVFERQNRMKNDRIIAIESLHKSGVLASGHNDHIF